MAENKKRGKAVKPKKTRSVPENSRVGSDRQSWVTPQVNELFDEYGEFTRVLYKSDPESTQPAIKGSGGLLGRFAFKSAEEFAEEQRSNVEHQLTLLKETRFFKRVCNNKNYDEAVKALSTRATQTKDVRYHRPDAEIALLRSFAMYLHFYEISSTCKIEDTIPTVDDLRAMGAAIEKATALLKQYSAVMSKIAAYPLIDHMANTAHRIAALTKTYRKIRSDARVREINFAELVAVALKQEFGECAFVVFAPLCALVNYAPNRTSLTGLSKSAIREHETLKKFDHTPLHPING
jgi:hypothetical protein